MNLIIFSQPIIRIKHLLTVCILVTLPTLIPAQIIIQEKFRCDTESFADFPDGDEIRQFKELWSLVNNGSIVMQELMAYFKIEDFYSTDNRSYQRYDTVNWQQTVSIKRTIIGDYDYIYKEVWSSKAQNFYVFRVLLKADTVFAVSIDNNCKTFTRYDKNKYRNLISAYSKEFRINKSQYKRRFSFFANYSCDGASYGIPSHKHTGSLNTLIDLVKAHNKKVLTKWINSIEPELKLMGIQGFLFLEKYQGIELTTAEKELIEKAKSFVSVLCLSSSTYVHKDTLLNDEYIDRLYHELINNNRRSTL